MLRGAHQLDGGARRGCEGGGETSQPPETHHHNHYKGAITVLLLQLKVL